MAFSSKWTSFSLGIEWKMSWVIDSRLCKKKIKNISESTKFLKLQNFLILDLDLTHFLITANHSFFNIVSSVIPLDKYGGSGERDAQIKILI